MTKYEIELKAIIDESRALGLSTRRLHWALARTTREAIERLAAQKVETMKTESEPFRRAGKQQHERAQAEIMAEETRRRHASAAVARHATEPGVRELDARVKRFAAQCRSDCELSLPGSLDRLDPAAMIQWHTLRELRRPRLLRTEPAELLRLYVAAMQAGDASALIDVMLIEGIAGSTFASTDEQRADAKALRERVQANQELREPVELIDVNVTIRHAQTAVSHCDLVPVHAINPERDPSAKAAFETEGAAFAEAVAAEAAGQ